MPKSITISPIGFWKLVRVCRRSTLSGGSYPLKMDRSRWIHSKSAKAEKLGRDRPSTTGRTWDTRHPCQREASAWRHFVKYLQRPSRSATQVLQGRSDRRNRVLPCSLFVRVSLLQLYHSSRVSSTRVEHCHVRGGAPTRLSGWVCGLLLHLSRGRLRRCIILLLDDCSSLRHWLHGNWMGMRWLKPESRRSPKVGRRSWTHRLFR